MMLAGSMAFCQIVTVDVIMPGGNQADGNAGYLVSTGKFGSQPEPQKQKISGGKCHFEVDIDSPVLLQFECRSFTQAVMASPGESITLRGRQVEGASLQRDYVEQVSDLWTSYNRDRSKVAGAYRLLEERLKTKNTDSLAAIFQTSEYRQYLQALNSVADSHRQRLLANIRSHSASVLPLIAVYSGSNAVPPTEDMYEALSPEIRLTDYGKRFREYLDGRLVGHEAIDFTLPDAGGKEHSLKELLQGNRYLIVDFWASWCGPCRRGIPTMKTLAHKYASEGLAVVNVSVDKKAEVWQKALKEEQMPWINLLDTEGVALRYGVGSIPAVFLIKAGDKTVMFEKLYGDAIPASLYRIFGY